MIMHLRRLCECGCGQLANLRRGRAQRFVGDHGFTFKGRRLSEEHKLKISSALKGREFSSEWKQKISESKKGTRHSEETKRKLSCIGKGRIFSEEHRINLSKSGRGRPSSLLGVERSLVTKRKISESHKGKPKSEEHKQKLSDALKGRRFSEEHRKKIMQAQHVSPNKPELKLQQFLDNGFPKEWKFVGDGSFILDGYNPDFININGKKQIIELFGDYWHRGEDPADRAKLFEPYGFRTLVIWEYELNNLLALGGRILEFSR